MRGHLRLASSDTGTQPSREPGPIWVVLADDHAVMRRTMRRLLDDEKDIRVRAEASSLSTLLGQIDRYETDVLVLDLRLPDGSTPEAIRRLRVEAPRTEIVVVTMEASPQFARQAIEAGAIGFVLKDRADSDLVTAVRLAARGEEFVTPRVATMLEAHELSEGNRELSARETELVRLIALGFTSREIATQLQLSRRTVETHRSRIYRKLDLTTRAELVRFALSRHMIE